jgi:hypothetical protein
MSGGRIVHELAHVVLVDAALGLGAHQAFGLASDQGAVEIVVAADVDPLLRDVAYFLEEVGRSVELRLIDKADPGFVVGRGRRGRVFRSAPEEKGIGQGVVQGLLEFPVMRLGIGLAAVASPLLPGMFTGRLLLRILAGRSGRRRPGGRRVLRPARVLLRGLGRLRGGLPGRASAPLLLRVGDRLLQRRIHRAGLDIGDVLAVGDPALDVGAEASAEHGRLGGVEGQVLASPARLELRPAPRAVRVAQAAPVSAERKTQSLGQQGRMLEVAAGQAVAQPAVFIFVGNKYRGPARVFFIFVVLENVVEQVVQRGEVLCERVEDGQVVLGPHLRAG